MEVPRYFRVGNVVVSTEVALAAEMYGPGVWRSIKIVFLEPRRGLLGSALSLLALLLAEKDHCLSVDDLAKALRVTPETVSAYASESRRLLSGWLRPCIGADTQDLDIPRKNRGKRGTKGTLFLTVSPQLSVRVGSTLAAIDAVGAVSMLSIRAKADTESPASPTPVPFTFGGKVSLEMVYIPGGEFRMGCDERPRGDERPEHWVSLSPFVIARYPTTVEEYQRYQDLDSTAPVPDPKKVWPGLDQPITGLTYRQFERFLDWIELDFPTEAQFEFASKGVFPSRRFPWPSSDSANQSKGGSAKTTRREDFTMHADYGQPAEKGPRPVRHFGDAGESWCGVRGLSGGVWQWCRDFYGPYYSHEQWNPKGPSQEVAMICEPVNRQECTAYRVLRGGSYVEPLATLEVTVRGANHLDSSSAWDGIRPASEVNWRFLRAHLRIDDPSQGDFIERAQAELRTVARRYRREAAKSIEVELAANAATVVNLTNDRLDAQYTVMQLDGSLLVHRHSSLRRDHGNWGEHELGLNLHALIISRLQASYTGVVLWIDDLDRPNVEGKFPNRNSSQLRINAAAYQLIPGLDRVLILEAHLHVSSFPTLNRSEWILWFRRAGWYVDVMS